MASPAEPNIHTARPIPEETYDAAYAAYWQGLKVISEAITNSIATLVLDTWPEAVSLEALGLYNEDGQINLRAQCVRNAEGLRIAGYDVNEDLIDGVDGEAVWEDAISRIDDRLDFLAQINDEDYLFTHVFVFERT